MRGEGNSSVMRKKQNGYHSQLCELPLYSRLGKLRASRETGFWTLHAQATAYGIAAHQLSSSAVHCMHTILHMRSQLSSSAVHCMHNGIAVQQFVTYTRYCIYMGSQFSSSAVQCMHKPLHMGSQFHSSAVHYMHKILQMGSQFSS
jgi:hypothetical protein